MPSGKGQRLIVVHATSADYRNEMNSEHFMEWFTQ